MVKFLVILMVICLIASAGLNIYQAFKNKEPNEVDALEQEIIVQALADLDKKNLLTNKITLTNINIEKKDSTEYRTYVMVIENDGIYIVSASILDGKVRYTDVEEQLK